MNSPNNKVRKKGNKINSLILPLNFLFTLLYMIWAFTPVLQRNLPYSYIFIIIGGWIFTAIISQIMTAKFKISKIVIILFYWEVWRVSLKLLGYSTSSWGNYYVELLFWFPIMLNFLYNSFKNQKYSNALLISSMLIIMFNILDNIRLLKMYPTAPDLINNDFEISFFYRSINIGSTTFAFQVILFIPIFLLIIKYSNKIALKIGALVSVLLIFYYLLLAGKTTSLIIALFAIMALIIIEASKRLRGQLRVAFIFFLISFVSVIYGFSSQILIAIADLIPSNKISSRITALSYLINGRDYGNASGSFAQRIQYYALSLNTFYNNFIIGVGDHKILDINYNSLAVKGIGQHSELIDKLARYGIVGAVLVVAIFSKFYKYRLMILKENKGYSIIILVFIMFVIYSINNNSFSPEIGIILFLIYPIVPLYINEKSA